VASKSGEERGHAPYLSQWQARVERHFHQKGAERVLHLQQRGFGESKGHLLLCWAARTRSIMGGGKARWGAWAALLLWNCAMLEVLATVVVVVLALREATLRT